MKKVLFLALLSVSPAYANEVKIHSFRPLTDNLRVAEVCGSVFPNVPVTSVVHAVVDYNTNAAAPYTFNVDPAGRFCAVVGTYYGRIFVSAGQATAYSQIANK